MPLTASFIPTEDRLDLAFDGDLDLTLTDEMCRVFAELPANLQTCILDLTRLERIFDSGLALLWMLNERLQQLGARVVVLSDRPEMLGRLLHVLRNALGIIPQDVAPIGRH
ncbi:STAS domain-containing protein [Caldichromatium japonicum]|uniref:STAS domain-containing protein n=1 Tax=Caldichromatium japonicum TaxID=2699430 RepID=A0A6G7VGI0_9GAMM|nr:STAS domain-containing protein [Caldichromatium japonicum]QIK38897.1 STAS domain-containing protein [Caldichromatium japonicum]